MSATEGYSYTQSITMVVEICCNCGIAFAVPSDFRWQCKNDSSKWFYCPNGHSQHYSESEAARLQKKLDKEIRERQEEKRISDAKLLRETEARVKVEKQLRKVHKGTCPCCKRSFNNLANHMKTKHPEEAGKILVLPEVHKKINKKAKV